MPLNYHISIQIHGYRYISRCRDTLSPASRRCYCTSQRLCVVSRPVLASPFSYGTSSQPSLAVEAKLSLRRTSWRGLRDAGLDVGTYAFKAQLYTVTYALGNERRLCSSQCIDIAGLESAAYGGRWGGLFEVSRARVCMGTAGLVVVLWDSVTCSGIGIGIQYGVLLRSWLLQWRWFGWIYDLCLWTACRSSTGRYQDALGRWFRAMSLVVGLGFNMGFCCIHGLYPYRRNNRLDIQFVPMNQHLPHLGHSMHITIRSAL